MEIDSPDDYRYGQMMCGLTRTFWEAGIIPGKLGQ